MTVAEVLPMPDERRSRLKELEHVIETGWEAAVAVGQALREIRDEGLYLELDGGLTFEQYCRSRWAIPSSSARRKIDAAEVAEVLQTRGSARLPVTTEEVGRELAVVLHNQGPVKLAEAWGKVSEAYAGQRPPTAREVHRILVAEGYRPRVGQVSTGKPNLRILLGQVGDRIAATEKRLEWYLSREVGDKSPAEATRKLALDYAGRCDRLAELLRGFAEGREP